MDGLSTFDSSTDSVGLKAVNHPGATVPTVTDITNLVASNATITNSNITLNANLVTWKGTAPSDLSANRPQVEVATMQTDSLTAAAIASAALTSAKFASGAIDAAALATDAGQELADRVLLRRISGGADSGRTVGEALYALRNRVDVGESVATVYQVDDSTSAWTASVTTAQFPVNSVNPA